MSNARNLANLLGTGTQVKTAKVADEVFQANESLIINGNFAVAQRGTSSTTLNDYQTVDRFETVFNNTDQVALTQSQSTTVPSGQGFANSWKLEVTTKETTLDANELAIFRQIIEAQNLQHLCYGTSSAKSLTLSFWVRSSLAGKYSVFFYNFDAARSNLQSFTINTANTWEYKTITIDGDTDSGGSFNDDNGEGLQVTWVLAAGTDWTGTPHTGWGAYTQTDDYAFSDQVNFIAQTGTFYITGVKLEVGSTATPYRHESYGENLAKCQRYYYLHVSGFNIVSGADFYSNVQGNGNIEFPVTMRASPSIDANSGTNYWGIYVSGALKTTSAGWTIFRNSPRATSMYNQGFSGATAGTAGRLQGNNSSARMAFDAEL